MRRALHLCDTLPQNQHWQSSHEENTRNQTEGHSAKYLASTPQNWQGLGKLGKTKKFTDEKSKETWRLNATWCPQLDPGADKGRCGKLVRSRWGLEVRYYNKCWLIGFNKGAAVCHDNRRNWVRSIWEFSILSYNISLNLKLFQNYFIFFNLQYEKCLCQEVKMQYEVTCITSFVW